MSEHTPEKDVGRCGDHAPMLPPSSPPSFCRLPWGHPGWHRGDDGSEWSVIPSAATREWEDGGMSDMRRIRYTDGTTYIVIDVPWGDGTGWIPPGHIDFQMTVTHEVRRFVYDGTTKAPAQPEG